MQTTDNLESKPENEQDQKRDKKKKRRLLKISAFILIILLLLLLLLVRCRVGNSDEIEQGIIDLPDTVYVQETINDHVEKSAFMVS